MDENIFQGLPLHNFEHYVPYVPPTQLREFMLEGIGSAGKDTTMYLFVRLGTSFGKSDILVRVKIIYI
jgi:hypothetical protein